MDLVRVPGEGVLDPGGAKRPHSQGLVAPCSQQVLLVAGEAQVSHRVQHAVQAADLHAAARLPHAYHPVPTRACHPRTRSVAHHLLVMHPLKCHRVVRLGEHLALWNQF